MKSTMFIHRNIVVVLLLKFISVATAEVCTYDDGFDVTTFICYSGCCHDECCDDFWSDSSIAGVVVAMIIGITILVAIIAGLCCRACRNNANPVRRYAEDRRPIILSGNDFNEQIATPFTVFPTMIQPPPYENVIQSGSSNNNQEQTKY